MEKGEDREREAERKRERERERARERERERESEREREREREKEREGGRERGREGDTAVLHRSWFRTRIPGSRTAFARLVLQSRRVGSWCFFVSSDSHEVGHGPPGDEAPGQVDDVEGPHLRGWGGGGVRGWG